MAIEIPKYEKNKRADSKAVPAKGTGFGSIDLFAPKLNDQKRLKIFSDLAVLIGSGVDLKAVITLLKEESLSKAERTAFGSVLEGIDKGKPLSIAMQDSGYFSEYECHTIKIGEQTGKLAHVLKELAAFYDERVKLKRMVVRALSYPVIVLLIAFAILYFMLQVVIPIFAEFFKQHDKELPDFTKTVIAISNNLDSYLLIFVIVVAGIVGMNQLLKNRASYKAFVSRILLSVPFVGGLIKEVYLSRFCQSMGFLLDSRVGLIDSLNLVKNTIPFYPINSTLEQVKNDVIAGDTLSNSINKHKIFGKRMVSLVKFGERSNQLSKLFNELGKQFTGNVEHRTKIVGNVVEPLLIVLIAGIVAVIMVSIYLPMAEMNNLVE